MTPRRPILAATSIAPGSRIAIQQDAIATWLRQGFRVASLNASDEIDALADYFPHVTFVPVDRTARLLTGRHHIFIDDILDYLARSDAEIVGVLNSDILLEPLPGLSAGIADYASNGLVCCPRLDVSRRDDTAGRVDPFGYDMFFFARAATELWGNSRLCLGQGYWDHYLPLMAILRGYPACKLVPPIGRHVAHETKREDSFFLFADEFAALATGFMADAHPAELDWSRFGHGFPKRAYAELRRKAEHGASADVEAYARYIDTLTRYVIQFIDANMRQVAIPAQPS